MVTGWSAAGELASPLGDPVPLGVAASSSLLLHAASRPKDMVPAMTSAVVRLNLIVTPS